MRRAFTFSAFPNFNLSAFHPLISAPEPTVDTLEIEAVAGRERFGFGTLERPDKGCAIVARLGIGGFWAKTTSTESRKSSADRCPGRFSPSTGVA